VDFEREGKSFDNYMELKYFLEDLLGLEVDLIMKGALKDELKDTILKELIYV
jgi:predicted nucleotidyltransferase